LRLNLFVLLLVIVALTASFSQGLRRVEIITPFYISTTSPFNTDWNGTSIIASVLAERGFHIIQCNSYDELKFIASLYRPKKIIYMYIAPMQPLTEADVNEMLNLMREYSLTIIIADEMNTSNNFLKAFNITIPGDILLSEFGTPFPIAEFTLNIGSRVKTHTLLLNYASWIKFKNYGTINVIGKCLDGRITAISKKVNDNDMIIVLSDSSIFINLMQRLSTKNVNYTAFILDLIDYASTGSNPEDVMVAFDLVHQEIMEPTEAIKHVEKAEVLFHPIMVFIAISMLFKSLEKIILGLILIDPLKIILVLIITPVLTTIIIKYKVGKTK